ncbi:hypothetical protein HHX47_DHR1001695 [Lentinula edodes]|nr:hypothetical protein HHX47_DHR1001695 [Lentinula edodes]
MKGLFIFNISSRMAVLEQKPVKLNSLGLLELSDILKSSRTVSSVCLPCLYSEKPLINCGKLLYSSPVMSSSIQIYKRISNTESKAQLLFDHVKPVGRIANCL